MPGRKPIIAEARKTAIQEMFKPEGEPELSLVQWLAVTRLVPEIKRILVVKYVGGGWSQMEDLDTIGPGFHPDGVEDFITRRWKVGRFRLQARGEAGITISASPIVYVGDWETAEAGGRPEGPGAPARENITARVSDKITERLDTMAGVAVLEKLDGMEARAAATKEFGPLQMMMDMMKTFTEVINRPRGDELSAKDLIGMMMTQQQASMALMVEMMKIQAAPATATTGAGLGAIGDVLAVLDKLRSSFGIEIGRGEGESGNTVVEAVKAAVPFLTEAIQRWPVQGQQSPRAITSGRAPTPSPTDTEEEAVMPVNMKKMIDVVVNALKSQHFPTVHAALVNLKDPQTGGPLIVINPDAQPVVYATLLGMYDARFEELETEIGAYLVWIGEQIKAAKAEEERLNEAQG